MHQTPADICYNNDLKILVNSTYREVSTSSLVTEYLRLDVSSAVRKLSNDINNHFQNTPSISASSSMNIDKNTFQQKESDARSMLHGIQTHSDVNSKYVVTNDKSDIELLEKSLKAVRVNDANLAFHYLNLSDGLTSNLVGAQGGVLCHPLCQCSTCIGHACKGIRTVNIGLLNTLGMDGYGLLHVAASKNSLKIVEVLLCHGCDPNLRSEPVKQSALHLAAKAGNITIVEKLLEYKSQCNALDEYHNTPLHLAALSGHSHIADTLINNGANCKLINKENKSPDEIAQELSYLTLAQKIRSHQ